MFAQYRLTSVSLCLFVCREKDERKERSFSLQLVKMWIEFDIRTQRNVKEKLRFHFEVFHHMAGARRAKLHRTVVQYSFRDLWIAPCCCFSHFRPESWWFEVFLLAFSEMKTKKFPSIRIRILNSTSTMPRNTKSPSSTFNARTNVESNNNWMSFEINGKKKFNNALSTDTFSSTTRNVTKISKRSILKSKCDGDDDGNESTQKRIF